MRGFLARTLDFFTKPGPSFGTPLAFALPGPKKKDEA